MQLLEVNGQAYLLVQQVTSSANNVAIYAVDTDSAELRLIFEGGTRTPVSNPQATWAFSLVDEAIIFNIGGGGIVAFDPQLAAEIINSDTNNP